MRKDGSLSLSLLFTSFFSSLPLTTDACLSEGVEGERRTKRLRTRQTGRQASVCVCVCARDEQTERNTLTETRFPLPSLTRND